MEEPLLLCCKFGLVLKNLTFEKHVTTMQAKWKIDSQIETGRVCCSLFLHVVYFFLRYFCTLLGAFANSATHFLRHVACNLYFNIYCIIRILACVLGMFAFSQGFLQTLRLDLEDFIMQFSCASVFPYCLHCSCTCCVIFAISQNFANSEPVDFPWPCCCPRVLLLLFFFMFHVHVFA